MRIGILAFGFDGAYAVASGGGDLKCVCTSVLASIEVTVKVDSWLI